jgi:hypothetical protein
MGVEAIGSMPTDAESEGKGRAGETNGFPSAKRDKVAEKGA